MRSNGLRSVRGEGREGSLPHLKEIFQLLKVRQRQEGCEFRLGEGDGLARCGSFEEQSIASLGAEEIDAHVMEHTEVMRGESLDKWRGRGRNGDRRWR
jgi:hypothetical protein